MAIVMEFLDNYWVLLFVLSAISLSGCLVVLNVEVTYTILLNEWLFCADFSFNRQLIVIVYLFCVFLLVVYQFGIFEF